VGEGQRRASWWAGRLLGVMRIVPRRAVTRITRACATRESIIFQWSESAVRGAEFFENKLLPGWLNNHQTFLHTGSEGDAKKQDLV
jgi:hypothetical protein